ILVLLIIFMVAAPLLATGVAIDLPRTKAAALNIEQKPISVAVDDKGLVYVMDQPVQITDLTDKLKAAATMGVDERIYVRGANQVTTDEQTPAQVKQGQRAEKLAELAELTPHPSPGDAPKIVPAPPPPLKRQADPGQAEPQEVLKPLETAKPAPKSEPAKPSVALPPKPPVNAAEETAPPESAQPKPVEPPKKPAPKFKPDQLAKLLDQAKQKEKE